MTILTRYILKKFLGPFFAIFTLLCIILFVSNILERLDRFLAEGISVSHVIGYLVTSMPFQALQILPIATFMATLFVVGNLARTKEYIAGLAGGIAPEKFLSGLLLSGLLISFLALLANETIIPPVTKYSRTVFREKIRRLGQWRQTAFTDVFVTGKDGRIWSAKLLNQDTGRMDRVLIDTYQSGKLGLQIDAMAGQWTSEGWVFYNGFLRTFRTDGLSIDTWRKFDEVQMPFPERPEDLVAEEPQPEQMNYKTLKRHIERLSSLGVNVRNLKVELMMKLAFPFSCFVVTILGIPLAMKGRGNIGGGIAIALVLTMAYMIFIEFGKALAQRLLPPLLGAWLGNIVFFVVGSLLWLRMRRTA